MPASRMGTGKCTSCFTSNPAPANVANVPEKAAENGPSTQVPASIPDLNKAPGPWLQPDPGYYGHLGSEPADRIKLSLSLTT